MFRRLIRRSAARSPDGGRVGGRGRRSSSAAAGVRASSPSPSRPRADAAAVARRPRRRRSRRRRRRPDAEPAAATPAIALNDARGRRTRQLAGDERRRGARACSPGRPTAPPTRIGDGYPAGGAGRERRERRTSASSGSTTPGSPTPRPHRRERARRRRPTTSSRSLGDRRVLATRSRSLPGRSAGSRRSPTTTGCGADPSARADIYLKQLGNQGLFGYESPDPGQGRARSQYGYLVLDNDYAPAELRLRRPVDPGQRHRSRTSSTTCCSRTTTASRTSGCSRRPRSGPRSRSTRTINDYLNYVRALRALPGRRRSPTYPPQERQVAEDLRLRGLEPLARHGRRRLRGRRDPPRLGGLRRDQAARLRARRLRPGDPRRRADAASAASSPRSPPRPPSGATGLGDFPTRRAYPDVKRKGSLRQARARALQARPHRLPAARRAAAADGAAEAHGDGRRAASAPGVALVARDGDPVGGGVTQKLQYLTRAARRTVTLERPGPLRADHRGGRQRRRPRPRLRAARLGLPQGRRPLQGQPRLTGLAGEPRPQRGRRARRRRAARSRSSSPERIAPRAARRRATGRR